MGTQTMGSTGSIGDGGGTHEPKLDGLARQGSLYNLTLDEVQHQLGDLGKPLSSMNLDELLKSVWMAEASQGEPRGTDYIPLPSASSLPRQSSITLSRDLSKKTVDEVWQDIQQGHKRNNGSGSFDRPNRERQLTLGEMTLEDFLVKAGVVAELSPGVGNSGSGLGADPISLAQQNISYQAHPWMQYQIPSFHHHQQQQQHQNVLNVFVPAHPIQPSLPMSGNPVMDSAYPDMSSSPLLGALSDTQTPGHKRFAPGDVLEKTVERRQKRMIKNRESAARSRARKLAYTHELENKVSRLEEENERLKRQREVEKVLPCVPFPEPKYQLRRTSSAPF